MPIDLLEQKKQPRDLFAGKKPVSKETVPEMLGNNLKEAAKHTYANTLAPLVHASSLLAGDIPKMVAKMDKSPQGKKAYDIIYPEQTHPIAKGARLGLSVVGLSRGLGMKAAGAAGNIMAKVASKTSKYIPKFFGKAALGQGAKLAAEGAAFGAAHAAENKVDYLDQIAGGAATNVVIPGAFKAIKSIPKASKWASARLIDSMIKPSKGQYAYGKKPGYTVAKKGITFNTHEEGLQKVSKVVDELGESLSKDYEKYDSTAGKAINLNKVTDPFDSAMDRAAQQNNSALLNRLNEIKKSIVYKLARKQNDLGEDIIESQGMRNLSSMSAKDSWELKKQIGKMTAWTGNPSDDKIVNSAMQDAYAVIRNKLDDAIPAIKDKNDEYGSLLSAKSALQNSIQREGKKDFVGLTGKIMGAGGALYGLASGNPHLIAEGLALGGASHVIQSPAFRTRLAAGLANLSNVEKAKLFQKFPDLSKGIVGMGPKERIIFARKAKINLNEVEDMTAMAGPKSSSPHPESFDPKGDAVKRFQDYSQKDPYLADKWKNFGKGAGVLAATAMVGSAKEASAGEKTLGQKNNNPINLKAFEKWDGLTGKDKHGHGVFKDLDHGVRAAIKNFDNRKRKQPNQTLKDYFNEFAEENGTREAEYIASKMGINVNSKLKDVDVDQMLQHVAKFESKMDLSQEYIKKVRKRFNLK